jgi:hypothetical protein
MKISDWHAERRTPKRVGPVVGATLIVLSLTALIGTGCGEDPDPTVPDVVGQTEADAVNVLGLEGFGVRVQQSLHQFGRGPDEPWVWTGGQELTEDRCPRYSNTGPAGGRVIDQAPTAGMIAPEGAMVTVETCVSIGPWEAIPARFDNGAAFDEQIGEVVEERTYPAPVGD